jgi:phosphoribosyl-AMP cyclohydrolase
VSEQAQEPLRFDADGLIPVAVQDDASGEVLMLAYMNAEALRLTRATGRAHYWSRSRRRIWRKGETSGNEQTIVNLLVNCERNSLLMRVRQTGAVCHDGYPTCFYRTLAPDNSLTIARERVFDPAEVYGEVSASHRSSVDGDSLATVTKDQFAAYEFLRDHDLSAVSATSARLNDANSAIGHRIADELRELAGVLDGSHRHHSLADDLVLEASQVIYWVLLDVIGNHVSWDQLRPDRALVTAEDNVPQATVARLLRAEAEHWLTEVDHPPSAAARAHAALALVGQGLRTGGVDPLQPIETDLAELRSRPYLAPHFAGGERTADSVR